MLSYQDYLCAKCLRIPLYLFILRMAKSVDALSDTVLPYAWEKKKRFIFINVGTVSTFYSQDFPCVDEDLY